MKTKSLILLVLLSLSFNLQALEYKTYSFSNLSKTLGYPSEDFFGSSEKEIFDLNTYIDKEDPCYQEINGFLRFFPAPYEWYGTGPDQAREMVSSIDKIFGRVPTLPEDLIFFRGLTLSYRQNKSYEVGEEFSDKGFVSSSTSLKVAKHFAIDMNLDHPEKKKAIFVMYLNTNSQKGILIDQEEDEIILKHGQLMKVMAVEKSAQKPYETYLVQVCNDKCESTMNSDIVKFWQSHHY
jgi:hypothetical protein